MWSSLNYVTLALLLTSLVCVYSVLSNPMFEIHMFVTFLLVTLLYNKLQGYRLTSMKKPLIVLCFSGMRMTIFVA